MIDLNDIIGVKLNIETLIGRNFYHYTNGIKDEKQPLLFEVSDLNLDLQESNENHEFEDNEDYDPEYEDEDELETLFDYVGSSCWVKRYATNEDDSCKEAYIIVSLALDDNMVVIDCCSIIEFIHSPGIGMFFPSLQTYGTSVFQENFYIPEYVLEDLNFLAKGRYLPNRFSFLDARLPQKMIGKGGNGEMLTGYTFALQSAYRQVYMHMSIDTNEDGMIENFYYSSYQSTGSSRGDMFSRPQIFSDRSDEAVDMLLYVIDKYSDDEFKKMMC